MAKLSKGVRGSIAQLKQAGSRIKEKKALSNKCVYVHYRNGKVFYVGNGSIERSSSTRSRSSKWRAVCPDYRFKVKIVKSGLTKKRAEILEKQLCERLRKQGVQLVNFPIVKPGVTLTRYFASGEESVNSPLSGKAFRALDVPWMSLDSYGSPDKPFRINITMNGETCRLFCSCIDESFEQFYLKIFKSTRRELLFKGKNKRLIQEFIERFEELLEIGPKSFLRKRSNPKRLKETEEQFIKYFVLLRPEVKEIANDFYSGRVENIDYKAKLKTKLKIYLEEMKHWRSIIGLQPAPVFF